MLGTRVSTISAETLCALCSYIAVYLQFDMHINYDRLAILIIIAFKVVGVRGDASDDWHEGDASDDWHERGCIPSSCGLKDISSLLYLYII